MESLLKHSPFSSRSNSPTPSHHSHHNTAGASTSTAPGGGYFADIAKRAVGRHPHDSDEIDHNNDAEGVEGRGAGKHEREKDGGRHPGLEEMNRQESGHISHGMPPSAFHKRALQEREEYKQEVMENEGEGPELREQRKHKEMKQDRIQDAQDHLKSAVKAGPEGNALASGLRQKEGAESRDDENGDGDLSGHAKGRHLSREEIEATEIKRAEKRLAAHAEHTGLVNFSSKARDSQRKWVDPDYEGEGIGRQPTEEEGERWASYPKTGGRPGHSIVGGREEREEDGSAKEVDQDGHGDMNGHANGNGVPRIQVSRTHSDQQPSPHHFADNASDRPPSFRQEDEKREDDIELLGKRLRRKGENGQIPDAMPGTKREERPGPRNEINLKPRITDMHYHAADAHELHQKANMIPLTIAPDGETEDLPDGKPFRHAPDQDDKWTSTREKEHEILGVKQAKDIENADYSNKRLMEKSHIGPDGGKGAPLVAGPVDLHNGDDGQGDSDTSSDTEGDSASDSGGMPRPRKHRQARTQDREEEDELGSLDGTAGNGTWRTRGTSVRSSEDGSRDDQYVPRGIPKADHRGDGLLKSVNDSPTTKRPKTQRIWSTFRNKAGSTHEGDDGPRQGSAAKSRRQPPSAAAQANDMQGPLDAERTYEETKTTGQQKWAVLRQKLLQRQGTANTIERHSTPATIPVTTELLAGQLPVMILKTWLDRDEHGDRAVPVLLGSLRFRVGDSAGLGDGKDGQTGREVFRIECEYGDGAVKWVIYRELRDFVSLHTHYKADNFGSRVSHFRGVRSVEIPEFPRTSIPYLSKFRQMQTKMDDEKAEEAAQQQEAERKQNMSRQEHSKESRAALQQYLVDLIRAVMFRPEANRLCRFFELSSLTLSLAPRGGFQGKAGFLRLHGAKASKRANQPGLMPTSWMHARAPKWWMVRESYFVATEGPESTELYEVFLIDHEFAIERPQRYYRKGLKKITGQPSLKAIVGYDAKQGQPNSGTAEDEHLNEIAAAAGSGQAFSKRQKDNMHSSSPAVNDGDGRDASQHTFYISNSQRRIKLVAKNVRQMQQFIVSMERIASQTVWSGMNRFDSFAPIRMNVAAQWLVDGRDYFWNLSRAINMAKERIYIHDWWISPELYLRRPGNERYRLDNLLKRKAEEGVKVFIILYNEVSDKTTPVDSTYTKKRLMGLHPNIMVQRSPSHFQTGTFYWSHHEKLCVIDEAIAFMGGLDLCYGRWDTSQHVLIDDDFEPGATGEDGPIWPGKDMANERVVEFTALNKPFEDSFDRTKVPRMPWHDVGLQIVGQPARDLCRHFVQRWNQLIRTKNHSRPMPFLLPPSEFTETELAGLRLQGTCEVQICRSCGPWSMGTPTSVEHSIQNAYLKAIQLSDHFVYIENQFFITSTVVDGVEIENRIGDALVDRIIRAHREGTPWKACIVIPLLPGYTFPLDTAEASSVRLILECQNRTISRGTQSIFSRLRKEDIDPNEYIAFFSLRGWGKFKSGALTTEQVYIHGKTMVVDDRLVICGSANINERSQRGDRDSELAAVVRDTDMIDGKMGGKPYKVGRYAHSLRVRLMREHLGVDVDAVEEDQLMSRSPVAKEENLQKWDPDHEQSEGENVRGRTTIKKRHARDRLLMTVEDSIGSVTKGMSENAVSNIKKAANVVIKPAAIVSQHNTVATSGDATGDPGERQDYDHDGKLTAGFASSVMPTLEEKTVFERRPSASHRNGEPLFDALERREAEGKTDHVKEARIPDSERKGLEGKPINEQQDGGSRKAPKIGGSANEQEKFGAPANAGPEDNEVPNRDTERDVEYDEEKLAVKARGTLRKHLSVKVGTSPWTMPTPTPIVDPESFIDPLSDEFWKDQWVAVAVHNTEIFRKVFRCIPDDLVTSWASYKAFANHAEKFNKAPENVAKDPSKEPVKVSHDQGGGTHGAGGGGSGGGIIGQEGKESRNSGEGRGRSRSKSDARGSKLSGVLKKVRSRSASSSGSSASLDPIDRLKGEDGTVSLDPMAAVKDSHGPNNATGYGAGSHDKGQGHGSGGGGSGGGHIEGGGSGGGGGGGAGSGHKRKASGVSEAWAEWEKEEMEALLEEVRGHLVVYPTRFLESEDAANNFLFNSDKLLPLPIYD